ncbi:MAG: hypothetical protein JXQ96_16175 [Cyclobacteriaceae bacterium]
MELAFSYLLLTTAVVYLRARKKSYKKLLWSLINIIACIPSIGFMTVLFFGRALGGMAGGKTPPVEHSLGYQVAGTILFITPFIVFRFMEMVSKKRRIKTSSENDHTSKTTKNISELAYVSILLSVLGYFAAVILVELFFDMFFPEPYFSIVLTLIIFAPAIYIGHLALRKSSLNKNNGQKKAIMALVIGYVLLIHETIQIFFY